jgi:phosphoserine phosphatase
MMGIASIGIAFNAKPKVQQLATARINQMNLRNVLYILGYSHREQEELLG